MKNGYRLRKKGQKRRIGWDIFRSINYKLVIIRRTSSDH